MTNGSPVNRYDRHQNKRAVIKKEPAKNRGGEGVPPQNFIVEDRLNNIAMVSWTNKGTCRALVDDEEISVSNWQDVTQKFKPVIGDHVSYQRDENSNTIRITGIGERQGVLARPRGDSTRRSASSSEHVIAANLDVAVIVVSAVNPPFHPRLVDRYLIICQLGDIKPILCVNKIDELVPGRPVSERLRSLDIYRDLGIDVVLVSALTGIGMDLLRGLLRGQTAALVGHSGVGKTTLINRLIPGLDASTAGLSPTSGKGQHTTTGSQVYLWDTDSYLIDTPGIRSLGVEDIAAEDLRYYFPEFDLYSQDCKYANCTHDHEPNCAVKEALGQRAIPLPRYESYLRLLYESQ